ncbi:MAG TPA: hypothetical protein VLY63_29545 [Anaerolineae bacterium]|nr:hypothetical protein [Anaerolineae bacterium]
MKHSFLMIARVLAVLVVLFAAVGVTQVYADPECPGSPSCSDKKNTGWGGTGEGQDDITNNDNVCGKGKGTGNPHCGGKKPPQGPPGTTPPGGFGPFFAPRTGSVEQPVTGALLRLGGFGTLFATALAFSIRRWRKSLL